MSDGFLDFSGQEFYDDDDLEEIEVDDSGLELSTSHTDADKSGATSMIHIRNKVSVYKKS